MHGDVRAAEVAHVQAVQLHPAQLCDALEGHAAGAADGQVPQRARLAADAAQHRVVHSCSTRGQMYNGKGGGAAEKTRRETHPCARKTLATPLLPNDASRNAKTTNQRCGFCHYTRRNPRAAREVCAVISRHVQCALPQMFK